MFGGPIFNVIKEVCVIFYLFFSFSFVFSLGPHVWHMEIPRLGGQIEAAATSLHHSHSSAISQLNL